VERKTTKKLKKADEQEKPEPLQPDFLKIQYPSINQKPISYNLSNGIPQRLVATFPHPVDQQRIIAKKKAGEEKEERNNIGLATSNKFLLFSLYITQKSAIDFAIARSSVMQPCP